MATKLIVSYPDDREKSEIIQADPFNSLKFICRLKKIAFEESKLVGIGNGYEYPIKGNIVIQSIGMN
jgi:hypothetical protein